MPYRHFSSSVVLKSGVGFDYKSSFLTSAKFKLRCNISYHRTLLILLLLYFLVCSLFKARYSVFAAIVIFFAAGLIAGPLFFRYRFETMNCSTPVPGSRCLVLTPSELFRSVRFRTAYYAIWSAIGTFLPLVLLTFSSCGLVVVLYKTRTAGITSPERYPCTRVTATVTAVVVTFIALVCPSTVREVRQ